MVFIITVSHSLGRGTGSGVMAITTSARSLMLGLGRAGVTIAAIAVIASHVDFPFLFSHAHKLSSSTLAISLAFLVAQTSIIAGLRLKLVLETLGQRLRLVQTVQVALSGFFFEQVAFGFLGGDAMRFWLLHRAKVPFRTALQAIVVDRGLGSIALLLLALAGLPGLVVLLTGYDWHLVVVAGVGAAGLVAALVSVVLVHLAKGAGSSFLQELGKLLWAAAYEPEVRRRLLSSFALALLAQGTNVLIFFLLGRDLAISLGLGYWFLIAPPALLISMLPISAGGWGLREASFVVALAGFGIRPEEAVIPPILFGLGVLIVTLPGGMIWWANRRGGSGETDPLSAAGGQAWTRTARDGDPVACSIAKDEGNAAAAKA